MATKTPKLIPIVQLGNCLRRKGFSLVQLCMSPYVRQLPAAEKQVLINAVRNINQQVRRQDKSDASLLELGLLRFGENQYVWQVTDNGSHTEMYPDGSLAEFKHRMLTLLMVMQ
ncbi:MAG: hypothetical protein ACTS2F_24910 [Thainema sp.]